ncbi:MAG TPA: hypothetical protein VGW77_33635 [Candidatus Binatia bacterium]|jgi:hypothetical protein|nr:hypothetical protein [Candidatus Binatia bacterium]
MLQPVKVVGRILLLVTIVSFGINFDHPIASAQTQLAQNYRELLDRSEKEKKGLTFYVKGQTISGVVVKIGSDAVEVRNQTFSRIVIRLESIDALPIN